MRFPRWTTLLCGAALATTPAVASETITYAYDALGRLVTVNRSGTVNNGASAAYSYDPANNRTNVTTTVPGGGGMAQQQAPAAKTQPTQQTGAGNGSHK